MMMHHGTTLSPSFKIYNYNLKLQRTFRPKIQLRYHTTKKNMKKYANLRFTYFKQWQVMSQEFGKIHIVDRT